jgi:DNA-binding response OmpR family regulator
MARVVFSGLDERSAVQLEDLLTFDGHKVRREHYLMPMAGFLNADIVFVGGLPRQYLPLLRRLRRVDTSLAVIVVAPDPQTSEWLDALEAGATDYCVPPLNMRQVRSLVTPRNGKLAMSETAETRR